ncbi:MAG: hypothetical protein GY803_10290 [Chloroflexi bacterium]|nr:hypothetical protein [Chloroflexota bacterium]
MMGKTHQVVGITLTTAVLLSVKVEPVSVGFGIGLLTGWLASVLPDIDGDPASGDPAVRKMLGIGNKQTSRAIAYELRRMGKAKKSATRIQAFGGLVIALFRKAIALITNIFAKTISHRGLTHWAVTWIGLTALLVVASSFFSDLFAQIGYSPVIILALPFLVGYGSHLLSDMATRSGLAILGPMSSRKYHVLPKSLRVRTGSWQEWVFLGGWLLITAVAAVYLI